MKDYPLVSIIILNFNGKKYLEGCFNSLKDLNYPKDRIEVIMADNASTDDSVEYVKNNFKWIRIVQFDSNQGFCRSNNLAAEKAKGEYLVFLNNDTIVNKDWLVNMVEKITADKEVVSCACKIFFADLGKGNILNAAGGVIFPTGCGLYDGWLESDSEEYNIEKYTGFGCGAGVLVEKKFFLDTGGFDEYYFYSGEEMDLGFRAWSYGYKVLYVPSAVLYHFMGRTGFRGVARTPSVEFLVMRNKLYFILKNFQTLNVIKGLLLSAIEALCKISYSLLHGNIYVPAAIMRAYGCVMADMKKILINRRQNKVRRKKTDRDLYAKGIIVSVGECARRFYAAARNMKKYFKDIYDTKDAVKIKIDKEGRFTFYKAD